MSKPFFYQSAGFRFPTRWEVRFEPPHGDEIVAFLVRLDGASGFVRMAHRRVSGGDGEWFLTTDEVLFRLPADRQVEIVHVAQALLQGDLVSAASIYQRVVGEGDG